MIPLHAPEFDVEDETAVLETLRSTWVSTGGPFVEKFEKMMAEFTGTNYAISCANGTVAIQLTLECLKQQMGLVENFFVIIPTETFIATANAVVHSGGIPFPIDSAPGRLNIDILKIEHTLTTQFEWNPNNKFWIHKKTKFPLLAVMPAHIMGWTCDMLSLTEKCKEFNLHLVEDAAEALGVKLLNGRHVGYLGKAAAFSFNANKILTTGGGGMITTNDENFAKKIRHLATTAKTDNLRFCHDEIGYNFRLVSILAALGVSQLPKLPTRILVKKRIFEYYYENLNSSSIKIINENNYCNSNYWINCAQFKSVTACENALNALLKADIQARPLWTPIHRQTAYQRYKQYWEGNDFPEAEKIWKTILSLPSSPNLKEPQIDFICNVIKEAAK